MGYRTVGLKKGRRGEGGWRGVAVLGMQRERERERAVSSMALVWSQDWSLSEDSAL